MSRTGPFHLRFLFDEVDCAQLGDFDGIPINAGADSPLDAPEYWEIRAKLLLTPMARLPRVRPIFPGSMRFVPSDASAPKVTKVLSGLDAGVVTSAILDDADGIEGELTVSIDALKHRKELEEFGLVRGIDECPAFATYNPVRLGKPFFEDALLNAESGLGASAIAEKPPTSPHWAAAALRYFLQGEYTPLLRAGANPNGSDDEAARLPMPEVVFSGNPASIALRVGLGWSRKREDGTLAVEWVPPVVFLQRIYPKLRNLGNPKVRTVVDQLLSNRKDDVVWREELRKRLKELEFAPLAGNDWATEESLREFQIAASADIVATPKSGLPSGIPRDFRYFVSVRNPAPYVGPASGRANQATRRLLQRWIAAKLRNPIFVVPYEFTNLDPRGLPTSGPAPEHPDLWRGDQPVPAENRVYVADFTRLAAPGRQVSLSDLIQIGHRYKTSSYDGPQGLQPEQSNYYVFHAGAEATPELLVGRTATQLLDAPIDPPSVNRAKLSTFRVVRAVAEQECHAMLDGINAYDTAGVSVGFCHWAGLGAGSDKGDELGGFVAYCRTLRDTTGLALFDEIRRLGFSARGGKRNGVGARLATLKNLDDAGCERKISQEDAKRLKSWRTYYRWVRLGRENSDFARASWHMTRRRIRDLLGVTFKEDLPKGVPKGIEPTYAGVLRTERLFAQVLRWHIRRPEFAVALSNETLRPARHVLEACEAAAATNRSPDTWDEALHVSLRAKIASFAGGLKTELERQFDQIADAPWVRDGPRDYRMDPRLRRLDGPFYFEDEIP